MLYSQGREIFDTDNPPPAGPNTEADAVREARARILKADDRPTDPGEVEKLSRKHGKRDWEAYLKERTRFRVEGPFRTHRETVDRLRELAKKRRPDASDPSSAATIKATPPAPKPAAKGK